jgi:hypothetical protein
MQCRHWPSCIIALAGASKDVLLLLTDRRSLLRCLRQKDKSRIVLNFLDLWGIIATGDSFNCGGV